VQPVAEYIVDNGLDADGARELVKAVKDHERRPEGREVRIKAHVMSHISASRQADKPPSPLVDDQRRLHWH
jgi:hypothetical protein